MKTQQEIIEEVAWNKYSRKSITAQEIVDYITEDLKRKYMEEDR